MNLDYAFLSRLETAGENINNVAFNVAFLASDNGYAVETRKIADVPING